MIPDRRTWSGIESDNPPPLRHHHEALLAMAERMLESRRKRFPAMIAAGAIDADSARAELAVFEAIAAEWRWIVSGVGEPAPIGALDLCRAALDRSIRTIADIARDERGFSDELADQADCVIAMRWHLEPGRRTRACAAISHELHRHVRDNREVARAA